LPDLTDWAFSATDSKELTRQHSKIPKSVDILVTHGPPSGILDQNARGQNIGCTQLLSTVIERVQPRLHVFGHCHEAYGNVVLLLLLFGYCYFTDCYIVSGVQIVEGLSTLFVNASSCNG
jgi:hypothetical protein